MNPRALLLTGATLLALGAGEILLRALDLPHFDACDTTADYAIPDPELGFRGGPGDEVAGIRLNEQGWRGPPLASPKPAGEHRILFLGDSTCWGLQVELSETFAARTAHALGSEFVLGAFPGYSSYHSAIVLERLLPLEPDLVVLYVGARNDGVRARYFPDADIPKRRARLDAAWHQVRLLRLVEVAIDRFYRSVFRKLLSREARSRVPPDAFRANLERILRRLEEASIPVVLVIPPLSPLFEAEQPQMRRYREILAEIAAAHGLPTVSVDESFAVIPASTLYFDDHYHLRAHGHGIIGKEITKILSKR